MIDDILTRAAKNWRISLPDGAGERFSVYHRMLTEQGKVMNLTRVPDEPEEAVYRNYLDSLSPLTVPGLLDGVETLCDAGTGAGLPGIPLAIALPNVRVTLIDALGKRVKFLESVAAELGLNVTCVHARLEDAGRDKALRGAFDRVTARAVAPLSVLCELSMPLCRTGGVFIAYKGPALAEELPAAERAMRVLGGRVRAEYPIAFAERDWDHRLLAIDQIAPTPAAYPRKAGDPARKPIS